MWLGRHRERDLEVAIKVMSGGQVTRPQGREAFQREVRAVAGLNHPAIVSVFDHGEVPAQAATLSGGRLTAGTPYLVMELVRGGSLRTVQPRTWDELRSALLELLEALAHAHARGVIHRDLKPGNVLVAAADEAGAGLRVSDFGLAASVEDPSLPLRSRFIMGTLQYMAPEQVSGRLRDVGPWTDLYSLGCVGWRLATGARAFESSVTRELIRQQMEDPPPPFLPLLPTPPGLEGWLLRLLHKDPARRFQRAADAAWALLGLGDAEGSTPSSLLDPDDLPSSGSYQRLSGGRPLSWTGWTSEPWSLPAGSARPVSRSWPAPSTALSSADHEDDTADGLHSTLEVATPASAAGWTDPLPPLPLDWRLLRRGGRDPAPLGVGLGLLGLRQGPVVGRMEQRDALWTALTDVVTTGSTRAVLLRGPSGIGKSRLVQWLVETAHETGHATVLRATHNQIPSRTDGLGPMVGRHLGCIGLTAEEVAQRVRRLLLRIGVDDPWEWAAVAQIVAPSTASSADGPVVRFGSPRERFEVLRRVIDYEARRRTVVLWLDDLQWSEETAGFVELLLERPIRRPVLLLATIRPAPVEPPWMSALLNGGFRRTLELPPLPRAEQADLLASLLGLAPRVSSEVLRRTEGRPLYATQLLGDWVRRGVVVPTPDGYDVPDQELALPESVHSLQDRRLERILDGLGSTDARHALELAAALGRSVQSTEWHAACVLAGVAIPDALVSSLVAEGLAEREPEGWRFTHNVLRDAIERQATAEQRWTAWNGVLVDALQPLLDTSEPSSTERLARHALAAARLVDGLGWLERAARGLRRHGNYARASALLSEHAGLRASGGVADSSPVGLGARVAQARVDASRGKFERSEELVTGIIADARQVGDDAALAEALRHLGFLAWQRARPDEARAAYREALVLDRRAGAASDAARCLLGLGVVMVRGDGDLLGASASFHEALQLFTDLDEGRGVIDALGWLAILARRRGDLDGARDLQRRALTASRRIGHRFGEMMALNSIGDAARLLGDHDDAERCYRESLAIARSTGSGEEVWPQLNLGLTLLDRGRYLEAEDLLDRSRVRLERMGRLAFVGCVHAALVPCAAARLDWEDFDRHVAAARRLLADTGMTDEDVAWPLERAAELAEESKQTVRAQSAAQLAAAQRAHLGDRQR